MNFKDYQNCSSKADWYDRLNSAKIECEWMIKRLKKSTKHLKKTKFYTLELTAREDSYRPGRLSSPMFDQEELFPLQKILESKLEKIKIEMEEL